MKKLRWAMDGFWDLDMATAMTIEGTARAAPEDPLPLGLSRGAMLSRPKQLDFMHRFMSLCFVPSYAGDPLKGGDGFSLQRAISLPFGENWFAALFGQFHLQKLISSMKKNASEIQQESSWLKKIRGCVCDRSLYALGVCSEFLVTPDLSVLLGLETHGGRGGIQSKSILHHRLPEHNLTVEAVSPGLFVDKNGNYWDVPLSLAIDLASVAPNSGFSHHLCLQHNYGAPKQFGGDQSIGDPPATLRPGFSVKSAFSFRKDANIWRKEGGKLRMVQPFDVLLSEPHVSISGVIGAVVNACFGDNAERPSATADQSLGFRNYILRAENSNSSLTADFFGSASFTAQYGNFQRLFFDLTRLNTRLDFPSSSMFLSGAAHLAQSVYNSLPPNPKAVCLVSPQAFVSFQQQIGGPFSFRIDSHIGLEVNNGEGYTAQVHDSVFAVEYALKVLGSAKAVAWYSPKHREAMVELRFFES
ncbi:LOW QUALITY PROTEIN: protein TRIGALACTOSYLDIACYLGLYCEROL 4, chloroplastic [Aristolochia californica]|uniref:LOW QUALITY PROTEIN: protein TRIGALACTOSYLDIACYLGLYCEROL 4, chloroplastic n=1 Tax=Aristolochia californica TaxID=171875 RepID=UPI0035DB41FC